MSVRLIRAAVCFYVMEAIDVVSRLFPRSPTRARIVNALARPFFPYAAYWALRKNPNTRQMIRELERSDSDRDPEGAETGTGSVAEGDRARAEGIAQPTEISQEPLSERKHNGY